MSKQRSRRAFLAAGGAVALGGCVVAGTAPGLFGGRPAVDVLAAGSLVGAFDGKIGPAFAEASAYDYRGEYRGSNAIVRLVEADQKTPDVLVVADPGLLREPSISERVSWDVTFAANELGIAYAPETSVGRRLEAGQPWYRVLSDSEVEIGRTDPDLDPLGYRTIMLFDLASRYYDQPELAAVLRDNSVVAARESHLLAGIESGSRPAAFCYRNMAIDHGLPFVDLPPELNFADPGYADHYASATYTTDQGKTIEGRSINYAAAVPGTADRPEAGRAFVEFLLSNPDLLREMGLVVPETLPRQHGRPPTEIRRVLDGGE
ncbi:extracellular solute-binding protein [Halapricum salinum]|nr:extracellular solute-binding protein [Halapricum salinum]